MRKPTFVCILLAAALTIMISGIACSEKESEHEQPIPQPQTPNEGVGSITFSISMGDGHEPSPAATPEDPAVVEQGDTLGMAISQQSSYTDPNGSVFTCEPKATITLFADTSSIIYVKDLQQLTSVSEVSKASDKQEQSELTRYQTLQKFSVGGKEVTFDLSHEIYNHVNSEQKKIEMPYIKVNSAQYGTPKASETRAQKQETSPVTVSLASMKLKRLPQTRGVVTDSVAYEVSATFNIDLESVHTENAEVKNLNFEINFTAIVETDTEYPDPTRDFSYELEIIGGTNSSASPFELKRGEALSLRWSQKANYTYFSLVDRGMHSVEYKPEAQVTLSAELDTVWVVDKEDLTKVTPSEPTITSSGENPAIIQGSQILEISKQKLTLNWIYEQYADLQIEDQTVSWPYIKLDAPRIVDVTKQVIPGAYIPNMQAAVYNVTVKLAQDLSTPGASPEQHETVEYLIRYIGVEAVLLTNVAYRKDYKLYEPHDNLPLRAQYILYRDRTYSNGQTYTDEFASNLTAISETRFDAVRMMESDRGKDFEWMLPEGGKVLYHAENEDLQYVDLEYHSRGGISVKTGVSDLSKLDTVTLYNDYHYPGAPMEDLTKYSVVNGGGYFNPDNPPDSWCWAGIGRGHDVRLTYRDTPIRRYTIGITYGDKFRWLDGQLFDFLEYQMTYDFEFKIEDTIMPDSITPAKVFTHIGRYHYLGREGEFITVDTVYQIK